MRRTLLIIALVVPLRATATECITVYWPARAFLMAQTDAVRATARSPNTLEVTSVLFGTNVHNGSVIQNIPRLCHPITIGREYFGATWCQAGTACEWRWIEVDYVKGYEEYALKRHTVTRPELMQKLQEWRKHKVTTEDLQHWLSTADASDTEGKADNSLVLAVVERIEDLLHFAVQAEACDPRDAAWLRNQGSKIFLKRFSRLPKQETVAAYEEWRDAHQDAKEDWNPKQLESDLELSLESAHSWNHTIRCYLSSYREESR